LDGGRKVHESPVGRLAQQSEQSAHTETSAESRRSPGLFVEQNDIAAQALGQQDGGTLARVKAIQRTVGRKGIGATSSQARYRRPPSRHPGLPKRLQITGQIDLVVVEEDTRPLEELLEIPARVETQESLHFCACERSGTVRLDGYRLQHLPGYVRPSSAQPTLQIVGDSTATVVSLSVTSEFPRPRSGRTRAALPSRRPLPRARRSTRSGPRCGCRR